ncbi:aminodeoxychorismate lyase [Nocardioides sp. S5]|uniref:endolytic transglycosylase MltG n=1 Tax=Nocardioides sp. S5 TaxID=2017486 RepID=UPI001A8E3142|nr:endolytic transglycosylase MltG [Nocardioides sp. S5]QSR31549.1 aminodeoxychorismate lyase [Nocardioides sp. S5]
MTEHESEQDVLREDDYDYVPGGRRRKGRGAKGCIAVLVALAVLVGGFYFGLTKGVSWVADQFQGPEDYPGPGTGSVEFTVNEGDVVAEIGRNLKEEGVTASVQAFIDAAAGEPASSGIQVGDYELQKEMKAADALEVLIDPDNMISFPTVTIPEGLRLVDIVSTLAENTDIPEAAWNRALQKPDKLGLPDYAEGNAEGYLFPATYEIKPGQKPVRILKMMVDRWREAADQAGLEEKAAELGKTPGELMIIASLIEAEGRGEDMPKIARVIYNRLDGPGDKGGTNGTLGIDASNAYGLGLSGTTALTTEQLAVDTPYDTRRRPGLPPTPIEAPGDDAIEAAANPADGPWYYYVTVNLETGETKFYEDYDDFLVGRDEYRAYCETSDRC